MAERSPEEIIKLVEVAEKRLGPLRDRMDEDYAKRWRLDEYVGEKKLDGFRKYTSNSSRVFGQKIVSTLADAGIFISVPQEDSKQETREINSAAERFYIGLFKAADERLQSIMEPVVQDSLAWHTSNRGWYAGVCALARTPDIFAPNPDDPDGEPILIEKGKTYPYIQPWDARNVTYARGRNGIEWACHTSHKTREDIEAEFSIELPVDIPNVPLLDSDNAPGLLIYDFWDRQHNTIVMEGLERPLKESTVHGSPRNPVYLGYVGPMSQIDDDSEQQDAIKQVGESIYSSNRFSYDEKNFVQSALSEFVKRSISPSTTYTSREGDKTTDDDPFLSGQQIALAEGEKIEPLELLKMAQETGIYLSAINQEVELGSLPPVSFGNLQSQLSGFAINSLKQDTDSTLLFPKKGMQQAYSQMCALMKDQYATGFFDPVSVSGRDHFPLRSYFSEIIPLEAVAVSGQAEVKLFPVIPEDDANKIALANLIRSDTPDGKPPLVTTRHAREMMGIQDPDMMEQAVNQEMAQTASPMALSYTLMDASAREGKDDYAQIWLVEAQIQLLTKRFELIQAQMAAAGLGLAPDGGVSSLQNGASGNGGGGRGSSGISPEVAPPESRGIQSRPIQQSGPLVAPNTPRPGARVSQEQSRLNSIGLVGAGQ